MKRIVIIILALGASLHMQGQTIDDIGKIVVGVKILSTATAETKNNATFLQNKLTNIAANAGFSSYGNGAFYMTPSVTVSDIQTAEGGMKNIYVVKGEIYLNVQEGDAGTVYASSSFPFKGSGTSKDAAIKNGLQQISYGNMKTFFDEAKSKILDYYAGMQDKIFANADMLAKNKEYDAAIACLLTIPEELFEPYQKAFAKACEIYQERDEYLAAKREQEIKDANNAVLVRARSLMASHDSRATLEALWDYVITGTGQDNEYQSLLKQAEARITAAEQEAVAQAKRDYEERKRIEERNYQDQKLREERAYADSRQEYADNIRYRDRSLDMEEKAADNKRAAQSEITSAVKSIALAFINKSKKL
jgi:hypothetical protein